MAIQYNDITKIGDVFEIHVNTPIIGIKSISGFIDVVLNETNNRYFYKEFRYSVNGITYSEWKELTNDNLINTFVPGTSIFDIQYRYTRSGTDSTGFLTFISIELTGTIEVQSNPNIFTDLYFSKFFNYNDSTVLNWALNVLNKLYGRGIIAKYVTRGEEGENDDDYLAFWGALTHFMAILVRYAREFRDFTNSPVLLVEYLWQKGIFVNDGMSLNELQSLLSNFYINFLKRGTNSIGDENGELSRLIRKDVNDEYIWGLIEPEKTIWNVGNNSPLYKGTKGAVNLVKAFEFDEEVQDLDNYPLVEESFISVFDDGLDVIRILNVESDSGFIFSGIGDALPNNKKIIIDSRVSYEITFFVKQAVLGDYLVTKVYLYDENEDLLLDTPISAVDGTQTNVVIDKESLLKNDQYYFVRVILFNENIPYNASNVLDIGFGNHLIINNSNAKFLDIEVGSEVEDGGSYDGNNDLRIYDLKVRPLVTKVSNSFVMISNIINSFIENNSEFQNNVVEGMMKRFLIPYNSTLINQFLDDPYIQEGIPLRIVINHTDETIMDANNGTIIITAYGGVQPYKYSIDNGSNFQDTGIFQNLIPAIYNILVEDIIGTQVTGSVTIISGLSNVNFVAFTNPSSRLDIADGVITAIASGGNFPYFYSKNGIDYFVGNIFTGLLAGNYTIYVRDTDGYQVSKVVSLDSIRNRTIIFSVVDELTNAIGSVIVSVISENYDTNSLGITTIYLQDGNYNFVLSKIGYRTLNLNNIAIIGDRNINITLQTYYSITFNVKDLNGVGLTNVTIQTQTTPSTQDSFTIQTPSNSGTVVKLDVIAGNYSFLISKSEFVSKVVNLVVNSNEVLDIILDEVLYTLDVTVYGQNPAHPTINTPYALSGADVRLNSKSEISNYLGKVQFKFVLGTYSLSVSKNSYENKLNSVLLNSNQATNITIREMKIGNRVTVNGYKFWTVVFTGPTSNVRSDNGTGFADFPDLISGFYTFEFSGSFGTRTFTNVRVYENNYLHVFSI